MHTVCCMVCTIVYECTLSPRCSLGSHNRMSYIICSSRQAHFAKKRRVHCILSLQGSVECYNYYLVILFTSFFFKLENLI